MSDRYHFVTSIELAAPSHDVWDALADSETWPSWWRWLREAEVLESGAENGLGRRVRNHIVSPLLYRLTYDGLVTTVEEERLVEFEASGDLIGTGRFTLQSTGSGGSMLDFDWVVETPKTWMRALAPVARPLFVRSHHRLMDDFARGLSRHLEAPLIRVENRHIDPDGEQAAPS
jgi:uncharacterized protein YndB with AHSA1/START domain